MQLFGYSQNTHSWCCPLDISYLFNLYGKRARAPRVYEFFSLSLRLSVLGETAQAGKDACSIMANAVVLEDIGDFESQVAVGLRGL